MLQNSPTVMTKMIHRLLSVAIGVSLCQINQSSYAEEPYLTGQNATIVGPTNPDLALGADELLAGNFKEGVRLSLLGLAMATGRRERLTALSNLCAGYIMLDQLDTALTYCDLAIDNNDQHWRARNNRALIYVKQKKYLEAEQDILVGQEYAPNSSTLKMVRSMLLDQTDPVSPNIIIDERRRSTPEGDDD